MTIYELFSVRFKSGMNFDPGNERMFQSDRPDRIEITRKHFASVLTKRGIPSHLIDVLFNGMDTDRDGKINGSDFQRVLRSYTRNVDNDPGTTRESAQNNSSVSSEGEHQARSERRISSNPKAELATSLSKKASTYDKFGTPRFIQLGNSINILI